MKKLKSQSNSVQIMVPIPRALHVRLRAYCGLTGKTIEERVCEMIEQCTPAFSQLEPVAQQLTNATA